MDLRWSKGSVQVGGHRKGAENQNFSPGAEIHKNSFRNPLETPNSTGINGTTLISPSFHLLTLPSSEVKPTHMEQEKPEKV